MCGIWSYIGKISSPEERLEYYHDFMKIKHRGPMYSSFQEYNNTIIGFHRLSIMDTSFHSNQPYVQGNHVFVCNGEIYNYKELNETYDLGITGKSDCMAIFSLYLKHDLQSFLSLLKEIKGEFAFLLYEFDENQKLSKVLAGRDEIGIRPLYYGYHENEYTVDYNNENEFNMIFSSEIKGCHSFKGNIKEFPPGNLCKVDFKENTGEIYDFTSVYHTHQIVLKDESFYLEGIRKAVIASIERRLDADQPIAFLLSGGVDSSLVAAISQTILRRKNAGSFPIQTFCCGMENGSDFKYAKKVANFIGSEHTEVLFSAKEALEVLDDVIYTTETWDVTTIRASVGQYLVSKYIAENTNAKVIMVGEGPDEVCSSYLFNWYARLPKDIHPTAVEYVKNIHYYDVKRADRCISRWGLEARVSLLDPEFIREYWKLPSSWRHPQYKGIEKYWLRKAFQNDHFLPEDVLMRKKEAFSDGISSLEKSWFTILQEHIRTHHGMNEKEYYKAKFVEFFCEKRINSIPGYWQPKWDKHGNIVTQYVDPSARTLSIYHTNNLTTPVSTRNNTRTSNKDLSLDYEYESL